jgi:hypothetical protein
MSVSSSVVRTRVGLLVPRLSMFHAIFHADIAACRAASKFFIFSSAQRRSDAAKKLGRERKGT